MKFFKNDRNEHIKANSPQNISLKNILKEVDRFPTQDEFECYFIGIINDKNEIIQFTRFERDDWFLDFPVIVDGDYSHSLQFDLTTKQLKEIIGKFFRGEDWRTLIGLTNSK